MTLAPIVLFTFKKLEPLKATVIALQKNTLANESELVVFSDAAAKPNDIEQVNEVRRFLQTITGFKKLTLHQAHENKGLATSIIEGVSKVLQHHERVIVMEDDLISSPNFLSFMNAALEFYKDQPKVFSIAGYTPPVKVPKGYAYDNYATQRASSWGWATYRNQWQAIDWKVSDYDFFKTDAKTQRKFNRMGSDLSGMLKKQMEGRLDSWAIRWCYHQFQKNLFTVFPVKSKILNIGFTDGATNTTNNRLISRFATQLDTTNQLHFNFNGNVVLKQEFIKYFVKPYSISTRIVFKLKALFNL